MTKNPFSKNYLSICLLIVVFILSGCAKKTTAPKQAPRVTTTLIEQKDVPVYVNAIGQAIGTSTVYIRPQVAGKLIKAYFEQGAIVNEGDILYEIDPRPFQAIVDQAQALLAHDQALLVYAEQAVQRYKLVVEQDFLSILNFEQYESNAAAARAQVEEDKAALVAAQINLDFCKVVAPVSGKIGYLNVYVGNILAVDDPNQITTILPFSPIDVTFSLPQQQFEAIRQEQGDGGEWPFVATLPERPKEPFSGTSYFIDNQINQNTGTILLKGRLPNEKRELWPGVFVRIKVLHKIAPNALTVPPSAVLMGRDGPYIYIINDQGKAVAVNVAVITRTEEYIAIESAELHAGETVVVDGQINLAPDVIVNVQANSKQ